MYFVGTATAMLADNTEHVISYWALYQKFHSPALGGFAVISHWLPYLLFSIHAGVLADRFDPRRLIQLGMLLFMGVSIGWGVLFITGAIQEWHARVLLVIHGMAGVLWLPASQVLLHDIVAADELASAVRLGATARYLGMLTGPAVGGLLLLGFGTAYGIFLNALIYLPMLLWLVSAPYGHRGQARQNVSEGAVSGWSDVFATFRNIRGDPILTRMMLLSGLAAFFIGNAYQAQMPAFAIDLGHGNPGVAYSMLLAADAAGALAAGFILESLSLLRPASRTALLLAMGWCVVLGSFALTRSYPLALLLLCAAGFLELAFNSMCQALVQINAPAAIRGRVLGVFAMSSNGMRLFSGILVGLGGVVLGIHGSLALSAAALLGAIGAMYYWQNGSHRGRPQAQAQGT